MKKLVVIASLLMSCLAAAETVTLADGKYSGKGWWKDGDGNKGEYTVEVTIANHQITSKYAYASKNEEFSFKADIDENGFFEVKNGDEVIGEGYCMGPQCHYEIADDDVELEETMTFYNDHLYRVGSKSLEDDDYVWVEVLDEVK